MLSIQLEVPWVSVAAFTVALGNVAPAAIAFVLGAHHYPQDHLKISACVMGSFLALTTVLFTCVGALPRRWPALAASTLALFASAGTGFWWLTERLLTATQEIGLASRLEVALSIVWILALVSSTSVLVWACTELALGQPIAPKSAYPSSEESWDSAKFPVTPNLGPIPVFTGGIPGNADEAPEDATQGQWNAPWTRSPHASLESWPETFVSHPRPQQQSHSAVELATARPEDQQDQPRWISLSPKKLSFKRSPSKKKSRESGLLKQPSFLLTDLATAGLAAVPDGLPPTPAPRWDWAQRPGEPLREPEQRSASGSTQPSIFEATDYNKKLNEAGFVREESNTKLRSKQSFSQYDLERIQLNAA